MDHIKPFDPKVENWGSYLDHFEGDGVCCAALWSTCGQKSRIIEEFYKLLDNLIDFLIHLHSTPHSATGKSPAGRLRKHLSLQHTPVLMSCCNAPQFLLPVQEISHPSTLSALGVERAPCRSDVGTVRDFDKAEEPLGHCDYGHSQVRPN
ncbi:UNVERIFIED_CONTAM: hypothetical protein K2H54_056529 [Gekko kuhli]